MRILIEPGDYEMTNLGDVAMMQVAAARLKRLWPHARVGIVTRRDDLLRSFCPGSYPVPADGQLRWLSDGTAFGGGLYRRMVPGRLAGPAGRMEARLRQRRPRLAYQVFRLWKHVRPAETRSVAAFFEAMSHADLVVVSGAGDITSTFERYALSLLGVLRLAGNLGARRILFGQGVGPIQTQALWNEANAVLPQAELIAIREKRKGVELLEKLGVDRTRIMVTGDDAVELAYEARGETLGAGLGINLRYAFYSAVDRDQIQRVRPVLHDAAARHSAALLPVPVRLAGVDSDVQTIRALLDGAAGPAGGWEEVHTPLQLVKRVGRCRVVVTGSYHAAVFALAQGIPAVGLAGSEYYIDKFLGLADMFGGGCELVRLDDPELPGRLRAAIDRAWRSAEAVRPGLLDAAVRQIAAGTAAYARCRDLVEDRRPAHRGEPAHTPSGEDRLLRVGEK